MPPFIPTKHNRHKANANLVIELDLVFVTHTETAVLLRNTEDASDGEEWVPKSLIELESNDGYASLVRGEVVSLAMPTKIAQEKGFV